jgi:hypothetical protein
MSNLRSIGLTGLVAGSVFLAGCQAIEDRVGQVIHGQVFPFHPNSQPQQQNHSGNNFNPQGKTFNQNFNSGEIKEIGAFGETYACLALTRIGNGSAFPQRSEFINKTSHVKAGSGILHFYVESSASFGDYQFQVFEKTTGREVLKHNQTSTDSLSSSQFYSRLDKSILAPGVYSLCLSGKTVKGYTGVPLFGDTRKVVGEHKPIAVFDLKVDN